MKLFAIVILAVLAVASVSATVPEPLSRRQLEFVFESWRIEHGIEYTSAAEYIKRMDVFAENHWSIVKHNALNLTYTLGHNEFSGHTHEEFKQTMLGFGKVPTQDWTKVNAFADADVSTMADSIDWTSKGAVTGVKNQGQCGSCWSFSTTGGLEGAYFLKNNNLVSFSEQNIVDCDHVDQGCNGGLMDNAFNFIAKNGGICTEADYPYTAAQGSCQTSCTKVSGSAVVKHTDVAQTEAAMMAAVSQQPVSIAIEADQLSFQFYSGGVMTGSCGTALDHGVLNVGYGVDSGTKYWKIKNSWGASWGESGYIRIERGISQQGGQCGLLMSASYPSL